MKTFTASSARQIQFILLVLAFTFIQTTTTAQNWNQIGQDIDGEAAFDYSGYAISLSADGTTLASGSVVNVSNGISVGHVRVYSLLEGEWIQQGEDINGEASDDFSGISVSLSDDGTIVAIGAYTNDGNGSNSGHVRVYKFISGVWIQQGEDIDGEAAGDFSGYSISLNADGLILAISARDNNGNGSDAGHVRVYKFISGEWIQQGEDINGEANADRSGDAVSLSSDGLTLAIGASLNNGNGIDSGHVRVYKFIAGEWIQQGADINGEAAGDLAGMSVSLSSDGLTLAIGCPYCESITGYVQVYKFIAGEWMQLGNNIVGEEVGEGSGASVSLSDDGLTLAIGAPNNDETGMNAGQGRVFKFLSGVWTQLGTNIDSEAPGDRTGWNVRLSADGLTLAISATDNDGNGIDAGNVRVYQFGTDLSINEDRLLDGISIFPNPTTELVTIELGDLKDVNVQIFNINGQLVYNKTDISTTTHKIKLNKATGIYFMVLSSKGETYKYKLVKE